MWEYMGAFLTGWRGMFYLHQEMGKLPQCIQYHHANNTSERSKVNWDLFLDDPLL